MPHPKDTQIEKIELLKEIEFQKQTFEMSGIQFAPVQHISIISNKINEIINKQNELIDCYNSLIKE